MRLTAICSVVSASLMLVALASISGCASHQSKQQAATDPAAAHELSPAEIEFESGSKRPPTTRTLYALSQILVAQHNDPKAEAVIRKIIADYPNFMPAYCELAELQMRQRRIEEAIDTLSSGLTIAPKEAVLVNDRGMCYMLLHDYPAALREFTLATAIVPDNARYRSNMASALGMLGRYDESLSLYLQVMPPADARHNLEVLRAARGDEKVVASPVVSEQPKKAIAAVIATEPEADASDVFQADEAASAAQPAVALTNESNPVTETVSVEVAFVQRIHDVDLAPAIENTTVAIAPVIAEDPNEDSIIQVLPEGSVATVIVIADTATAPQQADEFSDTVEEDVLTVADVPVMADALTTETDSDENAILETSPEESGASVPAVAAALTTQAEETDEATATIPEEPVETYDAATAADDASTPAAT